MGKKTIGMGLAVRHALAFSVGVPIGVVGKCRSDERRFSYACLTMRQNDSTAAAEEAIKPFLKRGTLRMTADETVRGYRCVRLRRVGQPL